MTRPYEDNNTGKPITTCDKCMELGRICGKCWEKATTVKILRPTVQRERTSREGLVGDSDYHIHREEMDK